MAYKCKPITSKASESAKQSMAKYMANLVNDLKGMYASKRYIDPAESMGKGFDRVSKLMGDFGGDGGGNDDKINEELLNE